VNAEFARWLFLASVPATLLVAVGARAIRGFSRHGVVDVCRRLGHNDRLGDILLRHDAVALGVECLQVIVTALMLATGGLWLIAAAGASIPNWGLARVAAYAAAGLVALLAIEVWLPRVVVRLCGAGFLVRTWPAWRWIHHVMAPLTWVPWALEALLARVFGRQPEKPSDELFEEEIRTIVTEGHREGLLERDAREMIEGVIELRDACVSEIMTPRTDMVCLHVATPLADVVRFVIDSAHTRIPVYDKNRDDVVGILYVRDLLPELARPPESRPRALAQIVRQPNFVPEGKPVDALLQEFQRNRNHMAIVLDEYGGVSGLVTIEDVLEEIVGEIVDEYDDAHVEGIKSLDERSAEALARVHIDEINDHLKIDLPDNAEFDTIGGLVFHELGRIPKPGEELVCGHVRITVLDVSRRRVERVRIEVLDPAGAEDAGLKAEG
jgi:CBS domain containing-hemolysin-like protein